MGPTPRRSIARNQGKFELLDDGGVIARRIIALPEQEDDVGAMLLRQVLWGVHQHVGDGAATTAVLYERIYQEGLRYIAAGADPMRLRARLMALLPRVSERLLADARPLRSEAELKALAFSVCYDEEMADVLGEVIHSIGQYGQVDIRAGHGRGLEYNYVEGSYWRGGAQSKEMLRGFQRPGRRDAKRRHPGHRHGYRRTARSGAGDELGAALGHFAAAADRVFHIRHRFVSRAG